MTTAVIVGGGVIGLLTARELLAGGLQVTLVDKADTGAEASWAGGGIVSPLYPWNYVPAISALASWAQSVYPDLIQMLRQETGIDPQLNPCGLLMLDPPEAEQALCWARQFGKNMQRVDADFVAQREPAATADFSDALWLPYVSNVRNPRLLQALKASLLRHPAFTLLDNNPVLAIEQTQQGSAAVVCAERRLIADQVVVCAGAWSASLLQQAGCDLPIVPVRGQMLLFDSRPGLIHSIVLKDGKYLIPRLDGHILVGSTTEEVGFDKTTTDEARELLLSHAFDMVPVLRDVPVVKQWAGLRPGSPGGLPFIGRIPGWNNLHVNAGHYRNGLVLAPASARLMADLLLQRAPVVDPAPYDPAGVRAVMAMV